MKPISYLLPLWTLLMGGCGAPSTSETTTENPEKYTIKGTLSVERSDDMAWILRYDESDIATLKERAASEESACDVLFFGSSSIRLWRTLAEDMAPLKVVNRGYGGATLRDIHYNYPTIMAHYQPRAFVIFCDNDICGSERDLHIGELFDHYRLLFQRLEQDYPGVPVWLLSYKYSELRASLRDKQELFNALMSDYDAHSEQLRFVNINPPLLHPDGRPNNALFEQDRLHVNREGYRQWSAILKPQLLEELGERNY